MIVYLERSDLNEQGKKKHYMQITYDDYRSPMNILLLASEVHCIDDRGVIFKTLKSRA